MSWWVVLSQLWFSVSIVQDFTGQVQQKAVFRGFCLAASFLRRLRIGCGRKGRTRYEEDTDTSAAAVVHGGRRGTACRCCGFLRGELSRRRQHRRHHAAAAHLLRGAGAEGVRHQL